MDYRERLDDPGEAALLAIEGVQATLWTALPCIVTAVNLSQMTVAAQPAIQVTVTAPNGTPSVVTLPLLVDVPIMFPNAGGYILTMPIEAGDEILVIFASRCIDAWWQSGGVQPQAEFRMHDLSDGYAIPGPRSLPRIVSDISSSKAQLRTEDGDVFLEIDKTGNIRLVAPDTISVEAATIDLTATDTISLTAATSITLEAPIIAQIGNLSMTGTGGAAGTSTVKGTITQTDGDFNTTGDVIADTISLTTHVHTSNTPGSPTSAPIP